MSVRSLTSRLLEERSETLRRSSNPLANLVGNDHASETKSPESSALFKGIREEQTDEIPDIVQIQVNIGLKPRIETPSENIPGGIAERFHLNSQRVSAISRSIDAYASQVTTTKLSDDTEDRGSDSAHITIELQSLEEG